MPNSLPAWARDNETVIVLAIGGVAYAFHELLGVFTGLHREYEDGAEIIEYRELHRAA